MSNSPSATGHDRWSIIKRGLVGISLASIAAASIADAATAPPVHVKRDKAHHAADPKRHSPPAHKRPTPRPPSPPASPLPPSPPASPPPPAPSPPSPGGPPSGTMKPELGGLLNRGFEAHKLPDLGGFVVKEDWASLEPSPGAFNFSDIDRQVASAAANGYGVKLRVYAGDVAPDWAKSIGGSPMPFYDHMRHISTTLGRFWTPAYQSAWQGLQTALAARYDGNPTVREVNVAGTGSESAEVCLLFANDKSPGTSSTNGQQYVAHGYTESARQSALINDINFMAQAWPHTHINLFVHPQQQLNGSGGVSVSLAATEALITNSYNAHPSQMVFGHTGLGVDVIQGAKSSALQMYMYILGHSYPFDIQTQTISSPSMGGSGVGNPAIVLAWAASHGLFSVELPSGWTSWSPTLLASVNASLLASAHNRT